MFIFQNYVLIITLVIQFWISGLFVLSVIFTYKDDIQTLTLCTFLSYAVGSFLAGIISDIYGRRPIFLISSVILTLASVIAWQYPFYGYILANLAIGPLNNLTFVFINQVHSQKAQQYTIYVLIGWAFSEITLGIFFYLGNTDIFMIFLLGATIIYMIIALMFVKQTDEFLKFQQQQNLKQNQEFSRSEIQQQKQQTYQNNKKQRYSKKWQNNSKLPKLLRNILPKTHKPLIGCSMLMFTMQMFYYRTQFTLDTFGISLQLNTIVVGCTQIFANLLFTKILQSVKRRLALRYLLAGLMVLLLGLIWTPNVWVQTAVQGLMRLVDTAIMIVLGVYIPELFPPNQKGRGTNFIMSFGVIGSALNGKLFSHLPFWSLQLFLIIALATTLLLKQTNNRNISEKQNSIEQIKESLIQNSNEQSQL